MSDQPPSKQRAEDGARAREDLNRRLQTDLDLGRLVRFKASYSPAKGLWNLVLAYLGAAILIAILVINLI